MTSVTSAMAAVPEQWRNRHRCTAWILFAVFFCAFILFFVSYVGNSWYVVPVENNRFPPDNPVNPMTLGLFYMCYRGQCMYDLRQDYQIVRLLPPQMGTFHTALVFCELHFIVKCYKVPLTRLYALKI